MQYTYNTRISGVMQNVLARLQKLAKMKRTNSKRSLRVLFIGLSVSESRFTLRAPKGRRAVKPIAPRQSPHSPTQHPVRQPFLEPRVHQRFVSRRVSNGRRKPPTKLPRKEHRKRLQAPKQRIRLKQSKVRKQLV
jgi:hypothetical protein